MSYLENLLKDLKGKAASKLSSAGEDISKGVNNFVNGVAGELKEGAQNVLSGVTGAVGGALDNVSEGMENASNWYSENILGEAPSSTPTQAPTQPPSTAPSTTPEATAPSGTPGGTSGTPGTEAAPENNTVYEPNTYTSQYAKGEEGETDEEHIPTYEEFLMGNTAGYDHIRTETSTFYDTQANKTLAALDEQKAAADDYAKGVRDAALGYEYVDENGKTVKVKGSLEEAKDAVYAYADEVLGSNEEGKLSGTLGYNKQAYDAIVKLLYEEHEAGKLNAEELRDLIIGNEKKGIVGIAEEIRKGVYDTAKRQRDEADKNADIYRERANVNANSAYEQNKANYGANAEVLGRMGITGGGYGDWVNGNAYATQRAEVQAANAEAEGAKREAVYTEDMLKLQADNEYNKQKRQAEFDYLERLYNLDSSYRTGKAEAEQTKAAADKAAYDTARDTKFQADSLEREGKAEAELDYNKMLYQNEADYKAGMLEAERVKEAGQFQANMDYAKNIMQNDERIAEYMEKLKAGDEEALRQQKEIFSQLLTGAANGTYGAEEIEILAKMFGFDESQTEDLVDSAGRYKTEAANKERTSNIIGLLDGANTGAYTVDQIPMLATELGLDPEDDQAVINIITNAAQAHQNGKSAEDTQYKNGIYADLMTAAASGSLDGEAVSALAKMFGFTNQDEINALVDASTRRNEKIEAEEEEATENNRLENEMNLAGSSGDQVGYIDKAIESGAISPEAGSRDLYNHFKDSLTSETLDYSEVERALESGSLSQDDFKKLQTDYCQYVVTGEDLYKDESGKFVPPSEASEKYLSTFDDPLINDETKKKLAETFYNNYGKYAELSESTLKQMYKSKAISWNEYLVALVLQQEIKSNGKIKEAVVMARLFYKGNDMTAEEISNATQNHIGTSHLGTGVKDSVGKILGK